MSEDAATTTNTCSACDGELVNLGVLGNVLWSRCRDCGLESKQRLTQASFSDALNVEDINTLRECVTCNARFAAIKDSDLCPECYSSFLGVTASNEHRETEVSAPVYCDFCFEGDKQVQASYDGKTKFGPWANMCEDHFNQYGMALGLGLGQKLIVKDQQ